MGNKQRRLFQSTLSGYTSLFEISTTEPPYLPSDLMSTTTDNGIVRKRRTGWGKRRPYRRVWVPISPMSQIFGEETSFMTDQISRRSVNSTVGKFSKIYLMDVSSTPLSWLHLVVSVVFILVKRGFSVFVSF